MLLPSLEHLFQTAFYLVFPLLLTQRHAFFRALKLGDISIFPQVHNNTQQLEVNAPNEGHPVSSTALLPEEAATE